VDGYNFKFAAENVITMTSNKPSETNPPTDVVIAWVDGDDPRLAKKRSNYVHGTNITIGSGAHSTRFASSNEIRYCVLSILRFAPFVRNIFIVTDEQDPDIYDDVRNYFPERLDSIRIVDHKEIFEGYENYLPTFNSISIANMIWKIKGLSENFVYFNDDTFLIRSIKPEDWFVNGRPVIRGRWVPAPTPRAFWNSIRISFNRHFLGKHDFEPRASFHLGQWNAAVILGFKFRYFTNSHTPHAVNRKLVEDYFSKHDSLLTKNISFRFRDHSQFTFISLSNHLQLLDGNRHIARPALAYLKPQNRADDYVDKKIALCESNPGIRFVCVQSLEMCRNEDREKLFGWLDRILMLPSDYIL
jgi:hypothetical protein